MIRSCSNDRFANCSFSPRTMDQEVPDGEIEAMGLEGSKEVRGGERDDDTGAEASVGVVDEYYKEELEEALEMMEPLPGMISDLLLRQQQQQQQYGGRRLTAAVDRALLTWQFIENELRSLIASLKELQVLLPDLDPNFIRSDGRVEDWVGYALCFLAKAIHDQLNRTSGPSRDGYQAAARCFRGDAGRSLFYDGDMMQITMHRTLTRVYEAAESPCRYKHLMLAGDVERTLDRACSSTAHPYSAHTGAGASASLVGIEGALRSKQLRWFMAADREADKKTLKVMAMVGPAGVGKTTLAMEVQRAMVGRKTTLAMEVQGAMVGPAGVGKTTLAMEIQRRRQQIKGRRRRFLHCATANVSQSHDIIALLKQILSQVEDKPAIHDPDAFSLTKSEEASHEMLTNKINQCLQKKRYLVTIDDVRKKTDWDIIKNAFPENNLGSRIMITTQLRSVAQFCCSHSGDGIVHEVKPLGTLDSKMLLFKKAFGSEDSCPTENLNQLSDEILRRCEGIPLFIIGMAGWLHQLQKAQGTNYSIATVPKLLKQFEQALATIYDYLPYYSKVMLMYMSVYTEGYTFEKDTLIEKWIHQGMISWHYGHERTVMARGFLGELIDRSIITRVAASSGHNLQVEEAYHWHVSYFMLQFLASKSAHFLASESANDHGFVCTLDSVGARGGKNVLRWLSLHQPHPELLMLLQRMDLSRTRLLSVSGEVSQIPLDEFSHLVVLDLEDWRCFKDDDMLLVCKMYLLRYLSLRKVTGVSKLPPEIKDLQHLLSLDISQTSICELPSQLCELEWLEKLDLRRTKVRQLPQQFWKLQKLECLLVGGDGVAGNETVTTEISEEVLRRLEKLEILTVVDLTRCSPSLVCALPALDPVEIAITWSFHQCNDGWSSEALRSCTRNWERLQSLTIHCGIGCRMDFLDFSRGGDKYACDKIKKFKMVDGRFSRVPKWFSGLRFLTFIEMTVSALLPGDLGILETLRYLECLVLGLDFIPEAELVIGNELCGLQRLSVSCRVPWITFTRRAMPKLTFLELKIAGNPASRESVPSGITNLGRLSDVSIRFHKNYINSPNVKMTVEAVKREIAEHRMPINLFINDIEDQAEDFQAAEEDLATASYRQSEIQNEDSSIGDQEEDVQAVEAGPASEIEEEE